MTGFQEAILDEEAEELNLSWQRNIIEGAAVPNIKSYKPSMFLQLPFT